jgi:hypothetical protein
MYRRSTNFYSHNIYISEFHQGVSDHSCLSQLMYDFSLIVDIAHTKEAFELMNAKLLKLFPIEENDLPDEIVSLIILTRLFAHLHRLAPGTRPVLEVLRVSSLH